MIPIALRCYSDCQGVIWWVVSTLLDAAVG